MATVTRERELLIAKLAEEAAHLAKVATNTWACADTIAAVREKLAAALAAPPADDATANEDSEACKRIRREMGWKDDPRPIDDLVLDALRPPPAPMCPDERCGCEYDGWGAQMRWCGEHPKAPRTPTPVERMAERLSAQAPPASDPPGLVALLKEPHFLGWPKTAAAGEYAYSRDAVMVSAAWYERLKALALPASPQAETKGDE